MAGRFAQLYRDADRFLQEYTEGLRAQDLGRVFRREAPDAYRALIRDHGRDEEPGLWPRIRVAFLALSYQLTPARRALFALGLVLGLVGLLELDIRLGFGLIDLWELVAPLGIGLLVLVLTLELADRIRVRDELEVARKQQRDLLPEDSPPIPGFTVSHSYRTANTVGGDYYDFLPLEDGRWLLVAGDASGHGMSAALLMVIAKTALEIGADRNSSPDSVAGVVHRALQGTGGRRGFLTLFCGRLTPETGTLEHVCAAHPFPLVRRVGGEIEELGEGSLPLGLPREPRLSTRTTDLGPGDLLLLYSDGLPETVNPRTKETFGYERIRRALARGGSPAKVHDQILSEYTSFLGGEAPTDDQSLVVLGRNPEG
ncbi:MAG: SpoIIE family protein phosphatase [Thermoanaerobaculia bacterium]|nr:SpoIIE family protein phosphatase [Thermoanaerobaculia bacterium]